MLQFWDWIRVSTERKMYHKCRSVQNMESSDVNIVTIVWEEEVQMIRFAVWRYLCIYNWLIKMIVGVQLSSGNSAPNSGNKHNLKIPFESGMQKFKRQDSCVFQNGRYESEPPLKSSELTCYKQFGRTSIIVLMIVESQRVHI